MDNIAQANIDRFEIPLTAENDPTKRLMIIRPLPAYIKQLPHSAGKNTLSFSGAYSSYRPLSI